MRLLKPSLDKYLESPLTFQDLFVSQGRMGRLLYSLEAGSTKRARSEDGSADFENMFEELLAAW